MRVGKSSTSISRFILTLLALSACATVPVQHTPARVWAPPPEAGPAIERARQAVSRSEYSQAIAELSPLTADGLDAAAWAEVRYLLGLSLFQEVCAELEACADAPVFRPFGVLTSGQVEKLTSAHAHLLAASDLAPAAPFAPEATYLAARSLDYGFLQRFEDAMELYRWCFAAYPGTPAAIRAKARHDMLRSKFDGMKGSAHGE